MTTLDNVRTTIYAYNELIERAADEMLKVYSYAPRGYEDLRRGDLKNRRRERCTIKTICFTRTRPVY